MMILYWILIIVALFYIIDSNKMSNSTKNQETVAEEVLKMRYVQGEINEETYKKMKKTIY